MSANFGLYSQYYDLLYQDKDYAGETAYIGKLLKIHAEKPLRSVLELGAGTGIHAGLLAADGMEVHGIELSETMLATAQSRPKESNGKLSFAQGDARSYRANRKFDAVISLFHVLSYQTTDDDLEAMMATAAEHLDAKGLFIFDFWYGPAVLWQRPGQRVKRWQNDAVSVLRIAEPIMHDAANTVDVNYTIFATDRASGHIEQIQETHQMRYLFLDEIKRLLGAAGFSLLKAEEWMSGAAPSTNTWGVCVIARKDDQ